MTRTNKIEIVIDFDGVIHAYTSKWTGTDDINDPPTEGAIDWVRSMLKHPQVESVTVNTARMHHGFTDTARALRSWFMAHGLEKELTHRLIFSKGKPHGTLYIDDRGMKFRGRFPTPEEMRAHQQWNKAASPLEVLQHDLREVLRNAKHQGVGPSLIRAEFAEALKELEGAKLQAAEAT